MASFTESRIKNLSAGRAIFIKASPSGHFVKAASLNGRFIKAGQAQCEANGRFIKGNGHFIKANGRFIKPRRALEVVLVREIRVILILIVPSEASGPTRVR